MRYIADVNVLLPILTEGHSHRAPAASWWESCDDGDVGLCLLVRMALLRLFSNRRVMGSGVLSPEEAWSVIAELTVDPRVVLVDQPPSAHTRHWRANVAGREPSPNLWTDAWLAALAQSLRCRVVTFDRGFKSFPKLALHLLSVQKKQG